MNTPGPPISGITEFWGQIAILLAHYRLLILYLALQGHVR
jgi:hypothetical protein